MIYTYSTFFKQTWRLLYIVGKINYFKDLYDVNMFSKMTLSRTCPTHDQINDFYCPTPYQLWLVFVKLNFKKLLLIKQWFYTMFSFNKLHFIVWNCFSNIYVLLYNENSFANMFVILKTYQILLQYSLLETIERSCDEETGKLISNKER